MRMDRTRGRSAAELLATLSESELAEALRDYGDEPEAERVAAREQRPADVRGGGVFVAQAAQLGHGRFAVVYGDRQANEAALADLELRADG